MERCIIVDYGSGNLCSAAKAFLKAAQTAALPMSVDIATRPEDIRGADRLVLPGVGAFGDCAAGIKRVDGLWDALHERVIQRATPFMGICVGMQLMAKTGEEHGLHQGFGWVDGHVKALDLARDPVLKRPHMGWNGLQRLQDHPVLNGLDPDDHVYFVHSYAMIGAMPVLAETDYGGPVAALVGQDNYIGTQFHPEKSQAVGLRLIENFLRWRP